MLAAKRFLIITLLVAMVLGVTAVYATTPTDDTVDNPIIAIEKTTTTPEIPKGGTAQFLIRVTNSGDVPLTQVAVSDPLTPNCSANFGTMQPEDVQVYSCERTNVQNSFLNEATATGRAPNGVVISDNDSALVNVDNPEISIIKDTTTPIIRRNGIAQFTITVFNDSNDNPLTNVRIEDDLAPNCARDIGTLAADDSFSYACNLSDVEEAFNNVATVFGTSVSGSMVEASDSAQIELLDLAVELTAAPDTLPEPGGTISFTAKITNTGSLDLELNSLMSTTFGDLLDDGNGNIDDNECANFDSLALAANGGELVCTFKDDISGQPGEQNIDLTAIADDEQNDGINVEKNVNIPITFTDLPSAVVTELEASHLILPSPGGLVEFTVTLNNNSEADTVVITTLGSNTLGTLHQKGNCAIPQTIQPQSSYVCTYETQISGSSGNQIRQEVTASGIDDDIVPNPVGDKDSVTILLTAPLVQYLPITPKVYRLNDEPNNVCQDAFSLRVDRPYDFAANDHEDWYKFVLTEDSDIFIELTNFVPRDGQAVLYSWDGVNCEATINGGSRTIITNSAAPGLDKSIDAGMLDAGHYLIRVINDGPATNVEYDLEIKSS